MKSGTEDKLKFKRLQRALKLPRWGARGLLDTMWKFAADNAPSGDIGRFSDEEIAIGMDWEDDPEKLINTLVETKWIDRTPTDAHGRLLVHDWADHCEDRVHKHLARRGEVFADGSLPSMSRLTEKERRKSLNEYRKKYGSEAVKSGHIYKDAPRTPTDAQKTPQPEPVPEPVPVPEPSHTSTSTRTITGQTGDENSGRNPADQREITAQEGMAAAEQTALELFKAMRYRGTDGRIVWKVAIGIANGVGPISEAAARSAARGTGLAKPQDGRPVNRPACFRSLLRESIGHEKLEAFLNSIRLPDRKHWGPPEIASAIGSVFRQAAEV